jgi:hypothetical protein
MENAAKALGLTRTTDTFRKPEDRIGPNKRAKKSGWDEIYEREIVQERYLHQYTPEMIRYVRAKVDPVVFQQFGYTWPEKGKV